LHNNIFTDKNITFAEYAFILIKNGYRFVNKANENTILDLKLFFEKGILQIMYVMERLDYEDIPKQVPRNNGRTVIGLALLFIGIVIFFEKLNIVKPNLTQYIFSWEAFLIFLGFIFIGNPRRRSTGIVLIGIGSFFLIPDIFNFDFNLRKLFFPGLLIGLGALFITRRHNSAACSQSWNLCLGDNSDFIDDISIFGGGDKVINSINFRGGRVTSIFGGSQFNLSNAEPSMDGCVVDMISIFGGAKFIVPPDWNVRIEVISIFGGVSDKRSRLPNLIIDPTKELIIKGVTMFGGAEIKTFAQIK
jgi:predicted membrane protein